MKIIQKSLVESIKDCKGTIIIIDVLRAFSTLCAIKDSGASEIHLCENTKDAETKSRLYEMVTVGESNGRKIDSFNLGNSPSSISNSDLRGKKVLFKTSSGTVGAFEALKVSNDIYLSSFINSHATVKHILGRNLDMVTIIALGRSGTKKSIEDELCSEYIATIFKRNGKGDDALRSKMIKEIMSSDSARIFLKGDKDFPESDLSFCLSTKNSPHVFKVIKKKDIEIEFL